MDDFSKIEKSSTVRYRYAFSYWYRYLLALFLITKSWIRSCGADEVDDYVFLVIAVVEQHNTKFYYRSGFFATKKHLFYSNNGNRDMKFNKAKFSTYII